MIANFSLPDVIVSTTKNCAPIAETHLGGSAAPIAIVDFHANLQKPGVHAASPCLVSVSIPSYTGSAVTIDLDQYNLSEVQAITVGGITFTLALDPNNPQPGEYIVG